MQGFFHEKRLKLHKKGVWAGRPMVGDRIFFLSHVLALRLQIPYLKWRGVPGMAETALQACSLDGIKI